MKRAFLVLVWSIVVAGAVSCFGCGGGSGTASSVRSVTNTFGSLSFTVSTPNTSYTRGSTIPISVTIVNTGTQPVQMTLGGCDDVILTVTQGNQSIWQGPSGGCGGIVQTTTFAPGVPQTFQYTWDQTNLTDSPVPTGTYSLSTDISSNELNGTVVPSSQIVNHPLSFSIKQ